MAKKLVAKNSITINATIEKVWDALVNPALIKQYLFGTNTETDWKKGSKIKYTGEWDGKNYEDKGEIIDIIPGKLLHTTYYSSIGGKEDNPENYNHVIYELEDEKGRTRVSISQDNIETQEELKKMNDNWGVVLEGMRKVVEAQGTRN